MWSHRGIAVLVLFAAPIALAAQPPALDLGTLTLDQLADRADAIVVSIVTSRRAEWEHSAGSRLIVTKVTLAIEQTLKGSPPRTLVVEVLGGTIGDQTLQVSHVPAFKVGDRDVLFLNGALHAASPIVGSDQGRFRVLDEMATGTARVLNAEFAPLVSAADIGVPAGSRRTRLVRSMAEAISLSDFVTLVRDRVRLLERRR
jgi:hypothetical protein